MKRASPSSPRPLQVRLPPFSSITLCLILDFLLIRLAVNPSTDNDNVTSAIQDDFLWRPVLLTHLITLDIQANTRSQDHEILIVLGTRRMLLVHSLHGNETKDESLILVSPGHFDSLAGVFAGSEVTLAGHFGEDEQTSVERLANRGETGDDAITRNGVSVGDVRPRGDFVNSGGVLKGDGVA